MDVDNSFQEVDTEELDLSTEQSARKLITQPYDLSVKNIANDVKDRKILLDVDYQRNYVWDGSKASRLIESLLLNVPIPTCYFAEDDEGNYEVIDGLQRITSIENFINNGAKLSGLTVLPHLNGKKYYDLEPQLQRRLDNRTIRCIVITNDSNPDIKFDVFERLNSGQVVLSSQELRNSIYRGQLNDQLKKIAANASFTKINPPGNPRMAREELILRYFALQINFKNYKTPLRQFLNRFMHENESKQLSLSAEAHFEALCDSTFEILGENPFSLGSKTNFNKAFYDAIMIPLGCIKNLDAVLKNKADVKSAINILTQDPNFIKTIDGATTDKQKLEARVNSVRELLSDMKFELTERHYEFESPKTVSRDAKAIDRA